MAIINLAMAGHLLKDGGYTISVEEGWGVLLGAIVLLVVQIWFFLVVKGCYGYFKTKEMYRSMRKTSANALKTFLRVVPHEIKSYVP